MIIHSSGGKPLGSSNRLAKSLTMALILGGDMAFYSQVDSMENSNSYSTASFFNQFF